MRGNPFRAAISAFGRELACYVQDVYKRQVIPRLEIEGKAVSASLVRRLYEEKDFAGLSRLVPETTLEYLKTR